LTRASAPLARRSTPAGLARHLARCARRAVLLFMLTCAAVIVLGFAALAEVLGALC
jgi:hypothetical protein